MSSPSNKSPPPTPESSCPQVEVERVHCLAELHCPQTHFTLLKLIEKKLASPLVPPPTVKSLGILEDLTGKSIALPVRKFILPIMHKMKENISHP